MRFFGMHYDGWVLELGSEQESRNVVDVADPKGGQYSTVVVSGDGTRKKPLNIRGCWKSMKKSLGPYYKIFMCCVSPGHVDEGKTTNSICDRPTGMSSNMTAGSVYEYSSSSRLKSRYSVHPASVLQIVAPLQDGYYSAMNFEERELMLKEAILYCRSRWGSSACN